MGAMQIIFLIVAIMTLGAALMVVTTKNLVHAALWLILTFFGVAVVYVLLNAGFLAVAQVVIYIGAIAVLVIFAVMMTRRLVTDIGQQVNSNWWLGALISAALLGGLVWMLSSWSGFGATPAPLQDVDSLERLGLALVDPTAYLLPFELASVLLLAALIGAIIIAWEKKPL